MNKKIVLIGGGGHCESVLDSLLNNNEYSDVVIVDNSLNVGQKILGCPVVGNDDILSELTNDGYKYAFISVGSIENTSLRRKIYNNALKLGFKFPNIIDKSSAVSKFAELENGIFIGKKAVINAGAKIGSFSIINTGAIIEHDCIIGKFSHISVGAVLCGNVTVKDDVFIGSNSSIKQGLTIGEKSVIGIGSVVISDVEPHTRNYGLIRRNRCQKL